MSAGYLSATQHPKRSAGIGMLFLLPFVALNAIVGSRLEPFFSLIRPGLHTNPREYVLLATALLLLPGGAYVALRRQRRLYVLNCLVAGLLLILFATIATALGNDIYACDVMQIPNCD